LIRQLGISEMTYYRWKKQYGGLESEQVRELKQVVEENARLKKLTDTFRQRLALLARQEAVKVVLARKDLVGGLAQDGVALENARARPRRKRRLGSRYTPLWPRPSHGRTHVVHVRGIDVLDRVRANLLATDQVPVNRHR
jgi:hypothetical protein